MTVDRFTDDRRGVSTTISFILATGITVILVAGLLLSFGAMMDGQENRAIDSELSTVAEGLAVDVERAAHQADRLEGDDSMAMRIEAPQRIAGAFYTIEVDGSTDQLTVYTDERTRSVELANASAVGSSSVAGGTIWIVADGSTVTLQEDPP
ncbi:MAG: hypothetical protein ACLFMX_01405 [Halobacteriales archaeon]